MRSLLYSCLLLICLVACDDRSEGCLDADASNFDVTAKEDCCCEYPQLTLSIAHQFGDETFELGKDYVNAQGQIYQVLSYRYYLSGTEVQDDQETWQSVQDSLALADASGGQSVFVADDAVQIVRNQFNYSVGVFLNNGSFDQLRMVPGLGAQQAVVNSDVLPDDHSLSQDGNVLYSNSLGYLDFQISLVGPESDTLLLQQPASARMAQMIDIESTKVKGGDLTVRLQVDYQTWFDDLDLLSDTQSEMSAKISARQADSFTFNP